MAGYPPWTPLPSGNRRDIELEQLKIQDYLFERERLDMPSIEKGKKMGQKPMTGRARYAPMSRGIGLQSMLWKIAGEWLSRRGPGAVPEVSDARKLHEKRYGERRYMYDPFEYVDRTSRAFGEWYSGQHGGGGGPPIASTRGGVHLPGAHLRAYSRSTTAADRRRESEGRYWNQQTGQWEHAEPMGRRPSDSFYAAHGMQTGPRAQELRKEREQIADALADEERRKQHERNMRYLAVGNEIRPWLRREAYLAQGNYP